DGEAGVISIFASALLSGRQPVVFGDGAQTRDYVYVHDTVRAFVLALDRAPHTLVNIGTGIETSVNQIHEMLASIIGVSPDPRSVPFDLPVLAERPHLLDEARQHLPLRGSELLEVREVDHEVRIGSGRAKDLAEEPIGRHPEQPAQFAEANHRDAALPALV